MLVSVGVDLRSFWIQPLSPGPRGWNSRPCESQPPCAGPRVRPAGAARLRLVASPHCGVRQDRRWVACVRCSACRPFPTPLGLGRSRRGRCACCWQAAVPNGPLSQGGWVWGPCPWITRLPPFFPLPPPFIRTGRPALQPWSFPRGLRSARRAFCGRGLTTLRTPRVDQLGRRALASRRGAEGVDQLAQRDLSSVTGSPGSTSWPGGT